MMEIIAPDGYAVSVAKVGPNEHQISCHSNQDRVRTSAVNVIGDVVTVRPSTSPGRMTAAVRDGETGFFVSFEIDQRPNESEYIATGLTVNDQKEQEMPKQSEVDMKRLRMSNTEIFDKSLADFVNKDRMADYGHPLDHFAISSRMKSLLSCPDPELKHAMEMICDKLARLQHSPEHLDSWIDIAGYARTAVMIMDEREKR